MDSYKKLKLEIRGIKDVIEQYSSDGNIENCINGLQQGLENDEIENVLYYLNELCTWYQKNISKIHSNEFVFNKDAHDRNKKLLEEIKTDLETYDFEQVIRPYDNTEREKEPKIFLSHRSSDKKYGDALEKLIIGLGVKNNQLIYTSHPLHKIPLDENIYDYLRKNINQDVFVVK